MNTSRLHNNEYKPPWKSWRSDKSDLEGRRNIRVHNAEPNWDYPRDYPNPKQKKRVTFNLEGLEPRFRKANDSESGAERRNLSVSKTLRRQFEVKSSRFVPEKIPGLSETHSSFRSPATEAPVPLPYGHPRVRVFSKPHDISKNLDVDFHEPRRKLDAADKIKQLKSKILSGQHVSMDEIKAVRKKLTSPKEIKIDKDGNPIESAKTGHPVRKQLFCDNGIVKVPTPHCPATKYNAFGSPADLRISLSNSDSPEYKGRRRFFFDFTGFADKDIKLSLENNRRLIIKACRPQRGNKCPLCLTESIELPKDLPVDNLRIVRDPFGTLIVEEAWKFA